MNATLTALIIAAASPLATPSPQPSITDRASLAAAVRASWPSRGVVTCEYQVTGLPRQWRKRVSYHLATGAWTLWAADGVNTSAGATPDGRLYAGQARLQALPHDVADLSERLDLYFPSFALLKHLERADAVRDVRTRPDGGFVIECVLPRGQRAQSLDQIPPALVESLGGPDKVMRRVTLEIDSALQPILRRCQDQPDMVYSLARCNTAGFAISQTCPWPAQEVHLVSCSFSPDQSAAAFELEAVQSALSAWQREFGDIRTPAPGTDRDAAQSASSPGPVADPHGSLARRSGPWLLAGGTLVLIGALAWLRRRAGGA